MCHAFSCIVTKDHRILRHSNIDVHSHEAMIREHGLIENKTPQFNIWVRVECKPFDSDFASPTYQWEVEVDEPFMPVWFLDDRESFTSLVQEAAAIWQKQCVNNQGVYKIVRLEDGKNWIRSISYLLAMRIHRKDGPAWITYNEEGNIIYEEYIINDKTHRDEDAPSIIVYYANGHRSAEMYCKYGKKHREKGPAIINYWHNVNVKKTEYWLNDQPNSSHGHQSIYYDENGREYDSSKE